MQNPPTTWFADPELDGPTPLSVTDDGRVYGHAALWGTCHTGQAGACVQPPRSASGYSYFRLGTILTEDGEAVPVGQITLGTGHAALALGRRAAIEHYEHTGTAIADVAVGEDAHGIWVAGALRPGVSAERVAELRAAKLSGDWRDVAGRLELVGLLAVNVPGFPVPHPRSRVASAGVDQEPRSLALVAAGTIQHTVRREPSIAEYSQRMRRLMMRAAPQRELDQLWARVQG